ncbi:hypothetical protein OEZ85_000654 [Tetradesmus obliquus]|uniref:K Homology domain-containing protein n=1 Tax=Tetradesmus obliquus TaxID=3088 RepID=A0ABY8UJA7_TETOB|nr:hypothetical protein OEZ85_000654 [Tetradesmus obliquus]
MPPGARVFIGPGGEVVISGSPSAVQAAAALVKQQIESFLASGGGYPHPLQVHYLLSSSYGDDTSTSVSFVAREDEVAEAAERSEQLHELQPAVTCGPSTDAARDAAGGIDALTEALSGVRVRSYRSIGSPISLNLAGQQPSVVQQLVAAAAEGVQHRPAFNDLKITFNFGKQLWYFPRAAVPPSWTVEQMQAKEIPGDFKCAFSNGVQASHVRRLQEWLASKGFEVAGTKERAIARLLQHGANVSYMLSFIKERDGTLTLRKAKRGNRKLLFLTLLNSSGQPDWRAKLLGQHHLQQGSEAQVLLARIAAGARLVGTAGGRLHLHGLCAHDMSLDLEQHRAKTIYLGTCSSSSSRGGSSRPGLVTQIKVSVSKMSSDEVCGYEVAGTSSQANALLQQMLASGGASPAQQAELASHVDNMLTFAQEAAAAVLEA